MHPKPKRPKLRLSCLVGWTAVRCWTRKKSVARNWRSCYWDWQAEHKQGWNLAGGSELDNGARATTASSAVGMEPSCPQVGTHNPNSANSNGYFSTYLVVQALCTWAPDRVRIYRLLHIRLVWISRVQTLDGKVIWRDVHT